MYWNQNRSEEDRVEMFDYKDAAEEMLLAKEALPGEQTSSVVQ
jgi:hypothetical protein